MGNVDPASFTTPEVNGTFNSWCGNCAAMSDPDGDNVWDITINMAAGTYEFKYSADNWGIQESLLPGSWCTVTNFGFTNRSLTVSGDSTLSVVCWESCDDCSTGPSSYNVTFEVDMRDVDSTVTTPESNGTFNGWCGNCWPMSDPDGDSIWTYSGIFAPGDTLEWKYSVDNWSFQEELDSNLSCVTINYDPGAPNGWGFVNRIAVVNSDTTFSSPWNLCEAGGSSGSTVYGCTDPLASNYDPLATVDDGSCTYTSSLISACGDFVSGPTAWPYVLVATTPDSGVSSQGAQTFSMNVTSLPSGGATYRVAKTTANGNWFFGPPQTIVVGSNGITVSAVTFNRAVKFQFSSGDVEFDFLSLNGVESDCVSPLPPPPTSLISACGDFVSGPTAWPYVLVATTPDSGAASQGAQTFSMNVT